MQGFPWYVVVVVPVVAFVFFTQRRRMAGALAENADKTLGAIAARLGLGVLEGDPNLNLLYFQQPSLDFTRKLLAKGQPSGRNISLTIIDGQKTSEFIVARRVTTSFGCFLDAETAVALPAFELCLRAPNEYLVPHLEFAGRPELGTVLTGDAELDRLFVIRAVDARIASALAPALRLLAAQPSVHLAGEGSHIWISFPRMGLPYFGFAPEAYLHALQTAASCLEGHPPVN